MRPVIGEVNEGGERITVPCSIEQYLVAGSPLEVRVRCVYSAVAGARVPLEELVTRDGDVADGRPVKKPERRAGFGQPGGKRGRKRCEPASRLDAATRLLASLDMREVTSSAQTIRHLWRPRLQLPSLLPYQQTTMPTMARRSVPRCASGPLLIHSRSSSPR